MATPLLGWDSKGDDFWVWVDPEICALRAAASAIVHLALAESEVEIEAHVVEYFRNDVRLHVVIPESVLMNDVEAAMWLDVAMKDGSHIGLPGGGDTISIRLSR